MDHAKQILTLWRESLPNRDASPAERRQAQKTLERVASLVNPRRYSIHKIHTVIDVDCDGNTWGDLWELRYKNIQGESCRIVACETVQECAQILNERCSALDNENDVDPTRAAHWSQYVL